MKYYKKIHIWNLPTNRIYIKFNRKFSNKFFNLAHKKLGNYNLIGKFLGVKRPDTTIAINWKRGTCCYPLNLMLKLANRIDVPLETSEKNIIEIKYKSYLKKRGGSSGTPIINPKLPIIINEDFAEILGHLCGDGTISRTKPKKGIGLRYINSEPTLIKSFQRLIKNVFGDVELSIITRKGYNYTRPNYVLQYPSIVGAFVLSVFDYKTKEKMNIPKFIFNMQNVAKAKFLRAIFDDEGSVRSKKDIVICLKPKKPLSDINLLLNDLGIETSNLNYYTNKWGVMWRFGIGGMRSLKMFSKLIGFKHPLKAKKLNNLIKQQRKFERYYNNEAKYLIMELLKDYEALELDDICNFLGKTKASIKRHLNNLKNEGLLTNKKIQKRINNTNAFSYVWYIKNGKKE